MKTIKELPIVFIHAAIITILFTLVGTYLETTDLNGFSKMLVFLFTISFILIVYLSTLILSLELKRKYKGHSRFTLAYYEGHKFFTLPWIIRYWLKWQLLKISIFYIRAKYEMKDKMYRPRGRNWSYEPVFCPECLWCGLTKNANHGYKNSISLGTEPVNKCPKCKNEL